MAKSDLFVRCPKFKKECDIDTCPRFLRNVEICISSNGRCSANGFCYEHGTKYITTVPQEYFCDRQTAASWELMERDVRDEMIQLDHIRRLLEKNCFFVFSEPKEGESFDEDAILFDTISDVIRHAIQDLDKGKMATPKVACIWQKVLPTILSFRDEETEYYIEEDPKEHPEAFEWTLPNGEKILMNFACWPHRLTPKVDRVRELTGQYLERALREARTRNSSSKDAWVKALGNYNRVKSAWTMPESQAILDEMVKDMIDGATRLSVDLSIPDPSGSIRNSETADAVAERLQPNFDEQKKSIASVARGVKSINDCIKLFFGKLIKWFAPRKNVTQEDVKATIDKSRRYECLSRVTNMTHKTQLMAIIDYTYDHPIVYEKDRKFGKDTMSLSEAARIVFDANIEKWRLSDDAWTDFEHFKSACYEYRGKNNDPYNYAT